MTVPLFLLHTCVSLCPLHVTLATCVGKTYLMMMQVLITAAVGKEKRTLMLYWMIMRETVWWSVGLHHSSGTTAMNNCGLAMPGLCINDALFAQLLT